MADKFILNIEAYTESESGNTEATYSKELKITSGYVGSPVSNKAIKEALNAMWWELVATFKVEAV